MNVKRRIRRLLRRESRWDRIAMVMMSPQIQANDDFLRRLEEELAKKREAKNGRG